MSRLATRIKDHPRRRTGISPRTWTNPTASATRLDPAALMPKGAGWTIPRLILPDGSPVPTEFRLVEGERAAAKLALNFLEAGIGYADEWAASGGSATTFIQRSLNRWLDDYGRAKIQEHFFLDVVLSTSLDRYCCGQPAASGDISRMFLTPRGSPQNRPLTVTSKPAISRWPGSLDLYRAGGWSGNESSTCGHDSAVTRS